MFDDVKFTLRMHTKETKMRIKSAFLTIVNVSIAAFGHL